MRVAIIGGGLTGLTAAIRLARQGKDVKLFEAAPSLGGRTRSFFDKKYHTWVDHGPHLMTGAYHRTRALLQEAGAAHHVHWQDHLQLPLWDEGRGMFTLAPTPVLPLAVGLPLACARLPRHDMHSLFALLRIGMAGKQRCKDISVSSWLKQLAIPAVLIRDLLEPLCLGAMNESPDTASAESFARVLDESFAGHDAARLGWFRLSLSEGLIAPLEQLAIQSGVHIHTRSRIHQLHIEDKYIDVDVLRQKTYRFDAAVLALSSQAGAKLLHLKKTYETHAITNIHLWFDRDVPLPYPLVGGLGTHGQWFFDIARQMDMHHQEAGHICAVISAPLSTLNGAEHVRRVCREIEQITNCEETLLPRDYRVVCEQRATTLVRPRNLLPDIPPHLIDASEHPIPGELPATIEWAVQRGEKAANSLQMI